ncbi:MAG: hypothetical protein L6Q38_07100 [Nitrospira sp.]|nr:hypothetical protein [Nitrospira sp.]
MSVSVRHGVNTLTLDTLAGKTVREVRSDLGDLLNIPESAQVRINGAVATDDNAVADGASVEFVRLAGEKGAQ